MSASPWQWMLVEVTAAGRLSSLLNSTPLSVSVVHDALVRSLVALAAPNELQPLLRQERSEAGAQIAQSLIDHPVCVFSVSRPNLYDLARRSRLPIHYLVLPCCVALQCCLVLNCWLIILSRLPI